MELLRSLLHLLLNLLNNTKVHVLNLLVRYYINIIKDIETAGQYFSQENPVIREITERVQRMYFMFSFINKIVILRKCVLLKKLTCMISFMRL